MFGVVILVVVLGLEELPGGHGLRHDAPATEAIGTLKLLAVLLGLLQLFVVGREDG